MIAPWSGFWEHNGFAESRPLIEAFLNSPYARGGVTGVGVVTALAGVAELGSVIIARARRRDLPPQSGSSA